MIIPDFRDTTPDSFANTNNLNSLSLSLSIKEIIDFFVFMRQSYC